MSTSEAVAVLKKQIEAALSEYTRGDLDILVHVIDISYNSLLASNKRRNTNKYALDYKEFLNTVRENSNKVSDYLEALTLVKNNKGTCLLEEEGSILLINKNFNTARDFITRISRLIKHNDSFGVSFRSRNLQEIETSRKYGKAKGSFFLRKNDNGYGVYKVDKLPETNTYGMIPVEGYQDVKSINYLAQVRSKQYSKSTNLSRFVDLEVEFNEAGEVVEKKSLYSVLDLGHGQGREEVQATPLGKKISNILELGISEKGRKLLNKYMDELVRLHNVIDLSSKILVLIKKLPDMLL